VADIFDIWKVIIIQCYQLYYLSTQCYQLYQLINYTKVPTILYSD